MNELEYLGNVLRLIRATRVQESFVDEVISPVEVDDMEDETSRRLDSEKIRLGLVNTQKTK